MKNQSRILLGLIIISTILLTSCFKSDHSVRAKNLFTESFTNISVNNASFGKIEVGETTTYRQIEEGSFAISGTTLSGRPLSGSGNISGKGTHKWTITISTTGVASISEDK